MAGETETPTGAAAAETAADTTPAADENPFKDFQSEGFRHGEPVTAEPQPQQQDTTEAKPKETPAGEEREEEETPKPGDPSKPPKKTVAERIGELTRNYRTAERERDEARTELNNLRARLEAIERGETPPKRDDTTKTETAAAGAELVKPDPKDVAKYPFGVLDEQYIADLAIYNTDKRWAELEASRQQGEAVEEETQERAQAYAKFQQQAEVGETLYEDYFEKVVAGAQRGEWALSPELGLMIIESEVGPHIAYHLATNPEEAARIHSQSPVAQARYFGQLEAKFTAQQSAATAEPKDKGKTEEPAKPPKVTKAPPPVEQARGAGGRYETTAATTDFTAFERMANEKGIT